MYNIILRFSILTVISLCFVSCTKNKLEGLELKGNKYEEWSQLSPFNINANPNSMSWSFKPEYLELLPSDEVYQINVYYGSNLRATIDGDRVSFIENGANFQNAGLTVLYADGHESPKSTP